MSDPKSPSHIARMLFYILGKDNNRCDISNHLNYVHLFYGHNLGRYRVTAFRRYAKLIYNDSKSDGRYGNGYNRRAQVVLPSVGRRNMFVEI